MQIFYDACQACLNVLIQQGIAESTSSYYSIYLKYVTKSNYIASEIATRQADIYVVTGRYDDEGFLLEDGMQSIMDYWRKDIQSSLNFEKYLGTDLWKEFSSFRREDKYSNSNFISDGLDNTQIFENALEFLDKAKKEIYKSATLQHSITATLKNLLVMKEFEPILDWFQLGNWIRIRSDGKVYRLRLIGYEINFNDLSQLTVTFSDVLSVADGVRDIESVLNQAAAMASSYDYVAKQASNGNDVRLSIRDWVNEGLSMTNMKIVSTPDAQDIVIDDKGILCRSYDDIIDAYDSNQIKIINNGIYYTNDGWRTAKAGLGKYIFYNPQTDRYEESYGLIADTIVGNIVLSKNVGVYHEYGNITMDRNGLTITADITSSSALRQVFTVRRKEYSGSGTKYTDLMYINSDGELCIKASELSISGLTVGDMIENETGNILSDAKSYTDSTYSGAKSYTDSTFSSAKSYADSAAQAAVDAQTQLSIFNKLTNGGQTQGIYLSNGRLYVNASYIQSGTLSANYISGGTLTGTTISGNTITGGTISGTTLSGVTIEGQQLSIMISGTSSGRNWTNSLQVDNVGFRFGSTSKSTSGGMATGAYLTIGEDGQINFDSEAGPPMYSGSALITEEDLYNLMYPVGSIYMTTSSSFSPSSTFGGSWTRITDRFLLGAGGSYASSSMSTGGSASPTLPLHTHQMYVNNDSSSSSWTMDTGSYAVLASAVTTSTRTYNAALGMKNAGSSSSTGNMPPWYSVYIWRRYA